MKNQRILNSLWKILWMKLFSNCISLLRFSKEKKFYWFQSSSIKFKFSVENSQTFFFHFLFSNFQSSVATFYLKFVNFYSFPLKNNILFSVFQFSAQRKLQLNPLTSRKNRFLSGINEVQYFGFIEFSSTLSMILKQFLSISTWEDTEELQKRKESLNYFKTLKQCSANFFASRHPWHSKRTFVTPSTGIDKSGAFNEYSRHLTTLKTVYATPSLWITALKLYLFAIFFKSEHFFIESKAGKLIGWKMFCCQFPLMLGCVAM